MYTVLGHVDGVRTVWSACSKRCLLAWVCTVDSVGYRIEVSIYRNNDFFLILIYRIELCTSDGYRIESFNISKHEISNFRYIVWNSALVWISYRKFRFIKIPKFRCIVSISVPVLDIVSNFSTHRIIEPSMYRIELSTGVGYRKLSIHRVIEISIHRIELWTDVGISHRKFWYIEISKFQDISYRTCFGPLSPASPCFHVDDERKLWRIKYQNRKYRNRKISM